MKDRLARWFARWIVRALRALWPEAQERYRVDPRRTYLAGFSGTAKFATWLRGVGAP